VTLVLILGLLCAAARASADERNVTLIHYLASSGAIAATVSTSGPPNTALAIDLYRNRCPARPAETDVAPGASADGEPRLLLANPPQPGEGGRFELCVWTLHEDGAVGARYSHAVTLPAPKTPSWNPVAGTSHAWWWPFVGWPTLLAILVVFVLCFVIPGALIRRLLRGARRHFGRSPEAERSGGEDGAMLDEVRRAAADAAAAGVAGAESPTLRYDTVPPPARPERHPGAYVPREPTEPHAAPGATSTTGGHPFTPPSPHAPRQASTEQPADEAAGDLSGDRDPDASDGSE